MLVMHQGLPDAGWGCQHSLKGPLMSRGCFVLIVCVLHIRLYAVHVHHHRYVLTF